MTTMNFPHIRFLSKLIKSSHVRCLGSTVEAIQTQEEQQHQQFFRTSECNPANHTTRHVNRLYTVPPEDVQHIYAQGLHPAYQKQRQTFNELSFLIRKPALEILSYLRATDYSKPVNRYVLYGPWGCGKSTTLFHILHYGYVTNKIIVNIPWAQHWFCFPKEITESIKPGTHDLPINAGLWLSNFSKQNHRSLPLADLTTTKDYEWNPRESTPKGAPLIEMINFGINRVKYGTMVIESLITELKQACVQGKCNVLVVIDGFNAFFSCHTRIRDNWRKIVPPSKVALTQPFYEITKFDWCNGAVVVAVDTAATKERRESDLPRYLLGKEGFEHLDPFVPVRVDRYTEEEFEAMIEYFKDRKWLGSNVTSQIVKELKVLTNLNPEKLSDYATGLY